MVKKNGIHYAAVVSVLIKISDISLERAQGIAHSREAVKQYLEKNELTKQFREAMKELHDIIYSIIQRVREN